MRSPQGLRPTAMRTNVVPLLNPQLLPLPLVYLTIFIGNLHRGWKSLPPRATVGLKESLIGTYFAPRRTLLTCPFFPGSGGWQWYDQVWVGCRIPLSLIQGHVPWPLEGCSGLRGICACWATRGQYRLHLSLLSPLGKMSHPPPSSMRPFLKNYFLMPFLPP